MADKRSPRTMSILDTWGYRPRLDVPYLMPHEIAHTRDMLEVGALTPFRMTKCLGCGGEVPICLDANRNQIKTHCSRACYEKSNEKIEGDDDDVHRDEVGDE